MLTNRSDLHARQLSPARQRLVAALQRVGFGTVRNLCVRGGEPVLDPRPDTTFRRKTTVSQLTRPDAQTQDFVLKQEWVTFFAHLDAMGEGVVASIEVAHGLPIVHEFEGPLPV